MKNAFYKTVISAVALTLCGCGDMGGDLADIKFHMSGHVVSVGSCGGGEGFFSGNLGCAVEVKMDDGATAYGTVYGLSMPGARVHRECFYQNGAAKCMTFKGHFRTQYKAPHAEAKKSL